MVLHTLPRISLFGGSLLLLLCQAEPAPWPSSAPASAWGAAFSSQRHTPQPSIAASTRSAMRARAPAATTPRANAAPMNAGVPAERQGLDRGDELAKPKSSYAPRRAQATLFPTTQVIVVGIGPTPSVGQGVQQNLSFVAVDTNGGGIQRIIPLPTANSGSQLGCTLSQDGQAGAGQLSADGTVGVLGCINAALGVSPVPTPATYVAARLFPDGTVDTSIYTNLTAFQAGGLSGPDSANVGGSFSIVDIRSLNSYDGKTSFIWGAKTSLGTPYATPLNINANVNWLPIAEILSASCTKTCLRGVTNASAVNNSLWCNGGLPSVGQASTSSTSTNAIFSVGEIGGPNNPFMKAPATAVSYAGYSPAIVYPEPATVGYPNPYTAFESQYNGAFAFTPDGTTLYVANAHIVVYTQSNGNWSTGATPSPQPSMSPAPTYMAMAGRSESVSGSNHFILYLTAVSGTSNYLYKWDATAPSLGTLLATSLQMGFRGVFFPPQPPPSSSASPSFSSTSAPTPSSSLSLGASNPATASTSSTFTSSPSPTTTNTLTSSPSLSITFTGTPSVSISITPTASSTFLPTVFPSSAVFVVGIGPSPSVGQGVTQNLSFLLVDSNGGGVVNQYPLPTASAGNQLACTLSQDGQAGAASLTVDGTTAVLGCINSPVNVSPVPSPATYVAARLLANGTVDTSISVNLSAFQSAGLNGPDAANVGGTFGISDIRSLNSYDGKTSFIWGARSTLSTPHTTGFMHHNVSTGVLTQFFSYAEQRAAHPVNNSLWANTGLPAVGQSSTSTTTTNAIFCVGDIGGPNNPSQGVPPVVIATAGYSPSIVYPEPATVGYPNPYTSFESQYNGAFAFTPDGTVLYVANAHIVVYTQSNGNWSTGATPSPQPSPSPAPTYIAMAGRTENVSGSSHFVLYLTAVSGALNYLYKWDATVPTTGTILATIANMGLRGVFFPPQALAPSSSPSFSTTPAVTASPTLSMGASIPPTGTNSPTFTRSGSPSTTTTLSGTPSLSITYSGTPSLTISFTPTPSMSISLTPTSSATFMPTVFPSSAIFVVGVGPTPSVGQGVTQNLSFIMVDSNGGGVINQYPVPTVNAGSQLACTLSQDGQAGLASLSANGAVGVVGCINVATGVSPVPTPATFVVARLLPNGTVDTSISANLSAFQAAGLNGPDAANVGGSFTIADIRSVNSYDGKSSFIWAAKSSLGTPHSTGFMHHNVSTSVLTQFFYYAELRAAHPVNNSLWANTGLPAVGQSSTSTTTTNAIFSVGEIGGPNNPVMGVPPVVVANAGQSPAVVYPEPATVGYPNPYTGFESQYNGAFAFTPDGMSLYVANAHIIVYTQSASVWSTGASPSPQPSMSPAPTYMAMAGRTENVNGSSHFILYLTAVSGAFNYLIKWDATAPTNGTILATAAYCGYRGIFFAPQATPTPSFSPSASVTPTHAVSQSVSVTASSAITSSISISASIAPTVTITQTGSFTSTATIGSSPAVTPTSALTSSFTQTLSASTSITAARTATASGSTGASPAVTSSASVSTAATPSGAGPSTSATGVGAASQSAAATTSGASSQLPTGSTTAAPTTTASVTGTSAATSSGTGSQSGSPPIPDSPTNTASVPASPSNSITAPASFTNTASAAVSVSVAASSSVLPSADVTVSGTQAPTSSVLASVAASPLSSPSTTPSTSGSYQPPAVVIIKLVVNGLDFGVIYNGSPSIMASLRADFACYLGVPDSNVQLIAISSGSQIYNYSSSSSANSMVVSAANCAGTSPSPQSARVLELKERRLVAQPAIVTCQVTTTGDAPYSLIQEEMDALQGGSVSLSSVLSDFVGVAASQTGVNPGVISMSVVSYGIAPSASPPGSGGGTSAGTGVIAGVVGAVAGVALLAIVVVMYRRSQRSHAPLKAKGPKGFAQSWRPTGHGKTAADASGGTVNALCSPSPGSQRGLPDYKAGPNGDPTGGSGGGSGDIHVDNPMLVPYHKSFRASAASSASFSGTASMRGSLASSASSGGMASTKALMGAALERSAVAAEMIGAKAHAAASAIAARVNNALDSDAGTNVELDPSLPHMA